MRQGTLATSLAHSAAGRLFGVFWGSLVVIDLHALLRLQASVAIGMVVLVVALGSWRQATPTVLVAAGTGWMFVNGFVVNQLGQLSWEGRPDFWRLLLLTVVALLAGRLGDLDDFLARAARWRRSVRVGSHAGPNDDRDSVGRERHAVGR